MFTILTFSVDSGIKLYGLFDTHDEALEEAEFFNSEDPWWIVEIENI